MAALPLLLLLPLAKGLEDACPAGGACAADVDAALPAGESRYPHPHAFGAVMHEGNSPHSFGGWPCELPSKLAWSWEPPLGKYSNTGVFAPVVDEELNLYVVVETSVRKFSPGGQLLWTWHAPFPGQARKGPSLWQGRLITALTTGTAVALNMSTGQLLWSSRVSETGVGNDFGWVIAREGVVVGDADPPDQGAWRLNRVYGLNASDGALLWDFKPACGVWNFIPIFLDDGTFAFQTWDGGAYRLRLADGKVLWHRPSELPGSWTDGGARAGPNGVMYVVGSTAGQPDSNLGLPGRLDALNLTDGALLWRRELEQSSYSFPAVGRLRAGGPLAVVLSYGSLAGFPAVVTASFGVVPGLGLGALLGLLMACRGCRRVTCCKRLRRCALSPLKFAVLGAVAGPLLSLALRPHNFRHSVQAFDAATGEPLWRHDLPPWRWWCAKGDEAGLRPRMQHGATEVCLPLASSFPVIDAQGIFYMGHLDGRLWAIQDRDGDGAINEEQEVCSFQAEGSFSMPGPTLLPGLMALGTCDSLYVFRE